MAAAAEVEQPPSLESGASNHENKDRTKSTVTPIDTNAASSARSGGPRTPSGLPSRSNTFRSEKDKKIGHRRIDPGGQVTYKKIQTTQIMSSIQLGISNAIGSLASKPERDLLMQDFFVVETVLFRSEGSSHTPAHHFSDFRFKTYSPIAFRYFRLLFGIEPDDFLMSLCDEPLIELGNPGASGSIFYLTQDDEFIIKTVQHKEGEFLQKLLPGYYMNLNQNPRTLLPKFFGLYCYQCNSKNVRLVAMNNLLPSSVKIHYKYDLKGSTYKRKASKHERGKQCPTYKDLDFVEHNPEGILLESETYTALISTLNRDCRVLESFKIMDYSMLVGVHNMDQAAREQQEALHRQNSEEGGTSASEGAPTGLTRSRSITRQRLVAHSTAMESIQAQSEPIDEPEDVPSGGIPARNTKGERLLLFIGIIDILQSYRLKKKLEHTWKSMIHDGDTVSVHRPGFYAHRFENFMANKVFKKIPSPLKHSPSKKRPKARPQSQVEGDGEAIKEEGSPPGTSTAAFSSASHPPPSSSSSSHPPPSVASINLPTVLKDRPPSFHTKSKVPPPVPPRTIASASVTNTIHNTSGFGGRPPTSTPPPGFEEAVRESIEGPQSSASPRVRMLRGEVLKHESEPVSITQITLESRSALSVHSESSSSTSGFGSTVRTSTLTWTPPMSVEGSTPTWTEGTPSYTDSSSSGDPAYPSTPVRSRDYDAVKYSSGQQLDDESLEAAEVV